MTPFGKFVAFLSFSLQQMEEFQHQQQKCTLSNPSAQYLQVVVCPHAYSHESRLAFTRHSISKAKLWWSPHPTQYRSFCRRRNEGVTIIVCQNVRHHQYWRVATTL